MTVMEAEANLDPQAQRALYDTPAYVSHYGLTDDPFNQGKPLFFKTCHLEELFRLLSYLVRFSRKQVVVTGEVGIGKTTLLEHFAASQNEGDLLCHFSALSAYSPAQVLYEIAGQLGLGDIAPELPAGDMLQAIETFSLARLDEGRSCLVVIDDAHLFEANVLGQLFQLMLIHSQGRYPLRLFLFGREPLVGNLQDALPAEAITGMLFFQQIDPLSFDETCQYLQVHFQENGGLSQAPFTVEELQHIYHASAGIPGRINEVAKSVMMESVGRGGNVPISKKRSVATWLLVACLLALGALYWWESVPKEAGVRGLTERAVTGRIERASAGMVPDNVNETEIIGTSELTKAVPEREQRAAEPFDASQRIAEVVTPAGPLELDTSTEQVEVVLAEPEVQEVVVVEQKMGVAKANAQQAAVALIVPKRSESPNDDPAVSSGPETLAAQHAREILALEKSGYTLQLMGSRSEESVLAMMNRLSSKRGVWYFQKVHKGAPWYVLIYGNYTSRTAADQAAASLPKAFSHLKPWTRRVSVIQQEVVLASQ